MPGPADVDLHQTTPIRRFAESPGGIRRNPSSGDGLSISSVSDRELVFATIRGAPAGLATAPTNVRDHRNRTIGPEPPDQNHRTGTAGQKPTESNRF
jgi:hypothetical protein